MINIDEVDKAIIELEQKDTSYAVVERLAWLYTVKDHLKAPKQDELTGDISGSEFCKACCNVPIQPLLNIIGEHMEIIKAIYPKEYTAIINKIYSLK